MGELLYGLDGFWIAAGLLLSLSVSLELGFRVGRRYGIGATDAQKVHVGGIQSAMLAVLGLVLGFTFSLALQRHDGRSESLITEVNAVGTAYLRTSLIQAPMREESQALLREFVDLRIKEAELGLHLTKEREQRAKDEAQRMNALWETAIRAMEYDKNPATTGLYIQSLNQAIDEFGRRDAEVDRHVPDEVLIVLYLTFVVAFLYVGYAAGYSGHRPMMASNVLAVMVVILAFVIIDLDRPRRGMIRVDHRPLLELRDSVNKPLPGIRQEAPAR